MKSRKLRKALTIGAGTAVGTLMVPWVGRRMINITHDHILKILMTDLYDENLWELASSSARVGLQDLMETNLRATSGTAINRPMGPPRKYPSLEELTFNVAQLHTMPTPFEDKIDTQVVIGKKAKKPLIVDIPILIAPMAYGEALSQKAKVAMAKGAAMAGTATNTGEGPFLQSERKAAKFLIYQYNRGDWGKTPEIMQKCDAIEIQIGQGAIAGVGHVLKSNLVDRELRNAFNYPKGKDVISHSRQPEVNEAKDLKKLVTKLKTLGQGIPVGVKIAAGSQLESDLAWICNAGADFIAIDGAEAATKGSPPILQDHFGLPLLFAIPRAANWLEKHKLRGKVALIVSGKLRTPGEILKAIALGADACYIGAIALFAMAHTQVTKSMPFEPPTQVLWYDGKNNKDFKVEEGAKSLQKFLNACKEEIDIGIMALGKTSLKDVSRKDLVAMSELASKACQVPMAYQPFDDSKDE